MKPRLGRAPTTCSSTPVPTGAPPGLSGRWFGAPPAWAWPYAFRDSARATIRVVADRHYRRTRYGWPVKILWAMSNDQQAQVAVALRLATRGRIWFSTGSQLTKSPLLDPSHPGTGETNAKEWSSVAYFPRAGCYSLTATSSAGAWQARFGFGPL